MKLIEGWRVEINRLWSIRVAIFAALLGVADPILALFQAQVPPLVYSLLCAAIIIARVLQQPDPEATMPGK
jgi:hypothetical protein